MLKKSFTSLVEPSRQEERMGTEDDDRDEDTLVSNRKYI